MAGVGNAKPLPSLSEALIPILSSTRTKYR